jgi:hypothetical protein
MPTTLRADESLPSPSWTFALLVGASPGVRLKGWVAMLRAGHFGEPTATDIWAQHGDALTAEAEAHGFVPHYLSKRRPTGAAFEAWRAAFLTTHTY